MADLKSAAKMQKPGRGVLARVRVGAGQLLSVPVYFGYEVAVRAMNIDRLLASRKGLSSALTERVECACGDLDPASIRLVEGARIPTRHVGVTFGSTVFVARRMDAADRRDARLLVHELTHVRQARRYGRVGMARRYGVEWCRCLSYHHHPFELEARRAEALA